jgi:hypothetical protein
LKVTCPLGRFSALLLAFVDALLLEFMRAAFGGDDFLLLLAVPLLVIAVEVLGAAVVRVLIAHLNNLKINYY